MQTESLDSTTLNTNDKQQNKAFFFLKNKYLKKKLKEVLLSSSIAEAYSSELDVWTWPARGLQSMT